MLHSISGQGYTGKYMVQCQLSPPSLGILLSSRHGLCLSPLLAHHVWEGGEAIMMRCNSEVGLRQDLSLSFKTQRTGMWLDMQEAQGLMSCC